MRKDQTVTILGLTPSASWVQRHACRIADYSKVDTGVSVSICLPLCAIPVTEWQPVQSITHLWPCSSSDRLQLPGGPELDKQ